MLENQMKVIRNYRGADLDLNPKAEKFLDYIVGVVTDLMSLKDPEASNYYYAQSETIAKRVKGLTKIDLYIVLDALNFADRELAYRANEYIKWGLKR